MRVAQHHRWYRCAAARLLQKRENNPEIDRHEGER